jgi:hypothetical protein
MNSDDFRVLLMVATAILTVVAGSALISFWRQRHDSK